MGGAELSSPGGFSGRERIELASADREIWLLWNRPTITPSRTPTDVRGALTWLAGAGFAVRSQRGGRTESFGNVLIEWERPPMGVQVVRDRGQWLVDIAAGGGDFLGLHVV